VVVKKTRVLNNFRLCSGRVVVMHVEGEVELNQRILLLRPVIFMSSNKRESLQLQRH
jgi:hypothetical protein